MKVATARGSTLILHILVIGCGPGAVGGSGGSSGDSTSVGSSESADEQGSETGVACEPPLLACGGVCVWEGSMENCGACGHACEQGILGGDCFENVEGEGYHCAPRLENCFTAEDGFATCREYCASIGEECGYGLEFEQYACWDSALLYANALCDSTHAFFRDPDQPEGTCDLPIPWGADPPPPAGPWPVTSAQCCCTQYGGKG